MLPKSSGSTPTQEDNFSFTALKGSLTSRPTIVNQSYNKLTNKEKLKMKKLAFGFATLVAIAATGVAGTETYSAPGKETKESKQVESPSCFSDTEWQFDVFGAYQVGNGPDHAGPIHDHAWGGGIAANYFFARYFGLSAEGTWLEGHSSPLDSKYGGRFDRSFDHHFGDRDSFATQFQSATGSVIFRYPIDAWCLAPYVFTGGGATMDGSAWAVYHIGAGLEYRVVPNKVGIFADGRWNYYGDRFGHDVQNNFLIRAGARLVF